MPYDPGETVRLRPRTAWIRAATSGVLSHKAPLLWARGRTMLVYLYSIKSQCDSQYTHGAYSMSFVIDSTFT